jgi:hypothetical protein
VGLDAGSSCWGGRYCFPWLPLESRVQNKYRTGQDSFYVITLKFQCKTWQFSDLLGCICHHCTFKIVSALSAKETHLRNLTPQPSVHNPLSQLPNINATSNNLTKNPLHIPIKLAFNPNRKN